jgi:homoisocitrate dehydrogenase
MTPRRLCVIEGDGIGKEVVPAAVAVLQAVLPGLQVLPAEAGWDCFQKHGVSVPESTLSAIRECGSAIFGAVQSPARKVEGYRSAIITMRQSLDLYANIRPVKSLPRLSPRQDIDMIIVRENTEGMYSGREHMDGGTAIAERVITRRASTRIGEKAIELLKAGKRTKLSIIHKANIMPLTDGLFRDSVRDVVARFRTEQDTWAVEEILVDTAANKIISEPEKLDVLVTTNLFGDILSDEAAFWAGGMGLAASINLGADVAVAEPVHGSAPDIAGKGIANPIAAILSAALLLRYQWNLAAEALRVEQAVYGALESGLTVTDGRITVGTSTETITRAILDRLV